MESIMYYDYKLVYFLVAYKIEIALQVKTHGYFCIFFNCLNASSRFALMRWGECASEFIVSDSGQNV